MAVAEELVKLFFNTPDAPLQPVDVGGGAPSVPALLWMCELHAYVRRSDSARHGRRDDRANCPSVLRPTGALFLVALDGIKSGVRHDRASTQGDEGERHHQVFRHASHLAHRGSPPCEGQSGEGLFALGDERVSLKSDPSTPTVLVLGTVKGVSVDNRIELLAIAALVLLIGCSSPPDVTTQIGLHEQLETGPSLNSTSGHYRAGTTEISLTKVVSLPQERLGFRFVISSPSLRGRCCSFFPRIALVGQSVAPLPDGTYQIDIAEDPVSVARDGKIRFHLLGGQPLRTLGSFSLDLSALGVSV